MPVQELTLDPAIRDWVLGPLTMIMLLSGLLRHYVTVLMNAPPKKQPLLVVRETRALQRSQLLRSNAAFLPPSSFVALKTHLSSALQSGFYLKAPAPKEGEAAPAAPNPLTDPGAMDGMMEMMKKQAVQFIPQTVLMYYIGFFFDGFVLTRLPFPLTVRFKSMLQRGIQTQDLDVSWVSSVSWYFLCLFGLSSVYRLLLGEDNAADGANSMAAQAQMGGAGVGAMMSMPGAPAQDFAKLFNAERENLEIVEYAWVGQGVEQRVLDKFGKGL